MAREFKRAVIKKTAMNNKAINTSVEGERLKSNEFEVNAHHEKAI